VEALGRGPHPARHVTRSLVAGVRCVLGITQHFRMSVVQLCRTAAAVHVVAQSLPDHQRALHRRPMSITTCGAPPSPTPHPPPPVRHQHQRIFPRRQPVALSSSS
jgi:hypothetical protein